MIPVVAKIDGIAVLKALGGLSRAERRQQAREGRFIE
jgi:hypothetical protein